LSEIDFLHSKKKKEKIIHVLYFRFLTFLKRKTRKIRENGENVIARIIVQSKSIAPQENTQ